MIMINKMASEGVSDSVLTRVFEMLVERLTPLENKVDRFEALIEAEQTTKYGRLNPKAVLDYNVDINVHEPLFQRDRWCRPAMYYVTTYLDAELPAHMRMYDKLRRELLKGEFDGRLANCNIARIQQNCWACLNDEEVDLVMCEDADLESSRAYVDDHVLDLRVDDWVSRNSEQCQTVSFMMEYGVSIWLEPTESHRKECDVVKTIRTAMDVLKFVGFDARPGTIQVATLGKREGRIFKEYILSYTAYLATATVV